MDLVILDPGHGGADCGAVNDALGIREKDITLSVARKVYSLLPDPFSGSLVRLTRSTDITASISARVVYADTLSECFPAGKAIFVSIHCSTFSDPLVRGIEIFHYPASERGESLAGSILDAVMRGMPELPLRGIKKSPDMAVLWRTRMTAILIEMEFISHPQAAGLLASESFQWRMAQSVARGIQNYLAG